jgi:hypothetical protein
LSARAHPDAGVTAPKFAAAALVGECTHHRVPIRPSFCEEPSLQSKCQSTLSLDQALDQVLDQALDQGMTAQHEVTGSQSTDHKQFSDNSDGGHGLMRLPRATCFPGKVEVRNRKSAMNHALVVTVVQNGSPKYG